MNSLLHSEILKDAHAGAVNLEPRWLKVDAAVTYSGISRAVLYRILAQGKIRSSSLRSRGALRGIRLIDKASLDAYIESFATEPTKRTHETKTGRSSGVTAGTSPENGNSMMYSRAFFKGSRVGHVRVPALKKFDEQGELCVQCRGQYYTRERRKHTTGLMVGRVRWDYGYVSRRFCRLGKKNSKKIAIDHSKRERTDGGRSRLYESPKGTKGAISKCLLKSPVADRAALATERKGQFNEPRN
jgi:hypothetical protein